MILSLLFLAAVALFIIAVFKQLLEINAFLNRLKERHASLYEAMGCPRWNIQFGDQRFREAVKYIRRREFEGLNDPELERCYRAIKNADRLAITAGVIAVGITLAEVLIIGNR